MFARLTNFHIDVKMFKKGANMYEKSVVPAARLQKGYKGAMLLGNPKTGEGVSITFWESEKDAEANEQNQYYQNQLVKFITAFTNPPTRQGFEVLLNE
ncbi:MAG: antibiotic biosynthesis monooxygenase family protein [Candidatus Aminicenantaceae bacterium]